jgi:hypothetical protein
MKTHIGCLGPLVLFTALGLYLQLTDGFSEDGGGRFAVIGLMGAFLATANIALKSLTARPKTEQRGFPVKLRRPAGEE